MQKKEYKIKIGEEEMVFEFSDLANQTNASVIVSYGQTKVLVTVVMGQEESKLDYLPLKVDYQERYYAAGEILGGKYNKREGRPSTEASLTARVIDRAIRPFFDKHLRNDVHIVATVLSLGKYDPDFLALNGTSIALAISDIPWNGPVTSVRVSSDKNNLFKINPDYEFREKNNLFNAIFSGKSEKISMIETEAEEASNEQLSEALKIAITEQSKIEKLFFKVIDEIGKEKKPLPQNKKTNFLASIFNDEFKSKIEKDFSKLFSENKFDLYKNEFVKRISHIEVSDFSQSFLENYFNKKIGEVVRNNILEKDLRLDGRSLDEVRPLYSNADRLSEIVHGTGIFYRGDTHVMSILTIGDLKDALFLDGMEIQMEKNYIHHYNFPPYSVGETGRMGSPKRREIGHGNLAEKALRRMIPSREDFPYTMRVVSEVTASQGSTSMASTCASTLALLSGGVPIKKMVAGIAIGLVGDNKGKNKLLTDILGYEDFYGDMDFKVAGTREGITAIQLDLKNDGISLGLISEVLDRAEKARNEILDNMEKTISSPAPMSPQIQKIERMSIPESKIGLVIGKGGVTIKKITLESGAKVDIKRDGNAFIYGSEESIQKAVDMIKKLI